MVDENVFFREAAPLIYGNIQAENNLKPVMTYLADHMPIAGIGLAMFDYRNNVVKFISLIWPPKWPKPPFPSPMYTDRETWIKEFWEIRVDYRIVNDIEMVEPNTRRGLAAVFPEASSHIIVSLINEESRFIGLVVCTEGKHKYTEAHARLLALLRTPFAQATTNMLQYNEIIRLKDMLTDDNRFLQKQLFELSGDKIIGAEFGLREVMDMVRQVAPLNSPVLLLGETGVGKEVIANAIHYMSPRRNNPFIKVNCGAIAGTLIDSELFGHEKGAFTGALFQKRGRFERAHTGTIFLDEIGELPTDAQVRLLRVLQQHEIERVGGTKTIPVDVRIISATHCDLASMVRFAKFREDLWYRLNVFPIMIPPLRERPDDISSLVNHFIERKSKEMKIRTLPVPAPRAIERLQSYRWPGNVRELENLVERAIIKSQTTGNGSFLDFNSILTVGSEDKIETKNAPAFEGRHLDSVISEHIEKTLSITNGKINGEGGAAEILGLHPNTLRGKMKKLNITHKKQRNA